MAGADAWNAYDFVVQMPHLAPGEKLSEVEFLKIIAAHQWESIARALGTRPSDIANDQGERLYGSVIDVELFLGDRHSMEILGEDAQIRVRNRVQFYAGRFVEGLFVIDDAEIPDEVLASVKSRQDLRSLGTSWACMTNAFIARTGSNVRLKVFRPAGAEAPEVPRIESVPFGITEQGRVQASGEVQPLGGDEGGIPLRDSRPGDIRYSIVPESDLNGAGLVYFARYEAMMNYGERIFLTQHLDVPISTELVSYLSTEHRRAFFFANASPTDTVRVGVFCTLVPPGSFTRAAAPRGHRVPFKLQFRIDLYRESDNVLMASSLVRKALHVPGNAKAVLAETERLLGRWKA
jgi:probable biosynthetic protein (TIGR04098 family)